MKMVQRRYGLLLVHINASAFAAVHNGFVTVTACACYLKYQAVLGHCFAHFDVLHSTLNTYVLRQPSKEHS